MMRAMRNRWNRGGPLLGVFVAVCLTGAPAVPLAEEGLAQSFWHPLETLPPELAERIPNYCGGTYLPPEFPFPLGTQPDEYPIHAEAGQASYQLDGDLQLDGAVRFSQGNRTVTAERGAFDQAGRQGILEGRVRLVEPGIAMQGERADVDLDTRAATLQSVEFLLLDSALRGQAQSIRQNPDGDVLITVASVTRCEPGNRNWRLSASWVELDEGEVFATARNAVLRIRDVPVFYAPWIRFPVTDERVSGWLFPDTSFSGRDGVDVAVPYYWNLAPNYDATISPRYVSDRGAGFELGLRHLSASQRSSFQGAYLHRDRLYDGTLSRGDFESLKQAGVVDGEFDPASRWLLGINQVGSFGNFSTLIDYTAVSDRDYFRNLDNDLGASSLITVERRAELRYRVGGLGMRLWAQRFQRLDEGRIDPYQRLPSLDLTYGGNLPGPLHWSLQSQLVNFDRDNAGLTGVDAIVGQRLHMEPRVHLPLARQWGFLRLTGGYRYTRYDLDDEPAALGARPDRGIGFGTAHGGLFFDRNLSVAGRQLIQTLEPQLFYLYQQYEDQQALPRFDATRLTFSYNQLFRDNRFSGVDRIGDANQLSVGLTSRLVDSATGREYLRASLGEIVYFEDRRVTLDGPVERQSTSALAGELSGQVAEHWGVSTTIIWNHQDNEVEEGAAGVQYRRDNRHIANVGYRWRAEDNINQTDVSMYWPISRHYAVLGRWNYDVRSGRTVEAFGGIEYNDCCWQIRFIGRRFVDSPSAGDIDTIEADDGVFLQIVFKGLAGFGTKVESVLARGIRGYRTEDFNAI
jgi:LPS-assembly protein